MLATRAKCAALILALAVWATPVRADDPPPFAAREGLDVARAAAHAWARDAFLIYVENDEALDASGSAPRWGYLFYSPGARRARVYSVVNGKILVAEPLEIKFEAPPLAGEWIDSGAALAAAEKGPGAAFRKEHGGRLGTMLLMRGIFHEDDPDSATWTLIYHAPGTPSLFVVVDAIEGTVRRKWRG